MAIKAKFTMNSIRERFDAFLDDIEREQIRMLSILGEKCVIHAKELPPEIGFHDRTGFLRGSIGYTIFKNGAAYVHGFGGEHSEGIRSGQELAELIGSETKGIALVVVAGMNYATYVEAKGRDVLASAEILAQRELPRMLDKLVGEINRTAK